MRARIDLAYDGTDFSGWARQPGLRTVQSTLESRIAQVLRLDEAPDSVCAGRTDAGVHARGQVVHVDLPDTIRRPHREAVPADQALRDWLPRALPCDIVLRSVRQVSEDFDARFSATGRRYVYRLWDRSEDIDPLTRGFTLAQAHRLDVDAMSSSARLLLGLHDFAAFCRRKDHGTTIRTLVRLEPVRQSSGLIEITAAADAFCHSMVRSLVGALVTVGRGQRDMDWIAALLDAQHRVSDIVVMPAHGLTLEEVSYPPDQDMARRAFQTRATREDRAAIGHEPLPSVPEPELSPSALTSPPLLAASEPDLPPLTRSPESPPGASHPTSSPPRVTNPHLSGS